MESPASTNEKQDELLLEQYKLYVELADRLSERRINTTSTFYSLVNTLIISSFGVLTAFKIGDSANGILMILIAVLGILFTVNWASTIRSYRSLAAAKYQVIFEMEKRLPFPVFQAEWEAIRNNLSLSTSYTAIISIEKIIQTLFIGLYLFIFILGIQSWSMEAKTVSIIAIGPQNNYVVLHNYSNREQDLTGWILKFEKSNLGCTLGGNIESNETFVIGLLGQINQATGFECGYNKYTLRKVLSGDFIILLDSEGDKVSKISIP